MKYYRLLVWNGTKYIPQYTCWYMFYDDDTIECKNYKCKHRYSFKEYGLNRKCPSCGLERYTTAHRDPKSNTEKIVKPYWFDGMWKLPSDFELFSKEYSRHLKQLDEIEDSKVRHERMRDSDDYINLCI